MEFLAILGMVWCTVIVLRVINAVNDKNELHEKIKEQVAERIHEVELEHVPSQGNLILAYDKENNKFLGQAHDVEGVKQVIMQRFPQHIFILNGEPFSAIPEISKL